MGCGESREKIENAMIAIKLERVGVQMARKNQIKLLEEMDGRKIEVPKIPDYLDVNLDKGNITKKIKYTSDNKKLPYVLITKKKRSQSVNIKKNIRNIKTNSTNGGKSSKYAKCLKLYKK